MLSSVAAIIKMVANPELTTLDEETNSIVMDIRTEYTAELAGLYDYLEKVDTPFPSLPSPWSI